MKKLKLIDIAPYSGKRVKPFQGFKRYMSTGGLKDEDLSFTKINFANKPSRADIEVQEGDVLFAKMTHTNKALLIDKELDGIIVSTGFSVHRPKENELDGEYLFHYLKHEYFHRQKNKLCTGAIQSAISNKGIEKIMVPVPAFSDQRHIASILSKAENLIAHRKESIALLDEFLKSTFTDFFDNPVTNRKNYKVVTFKELITFLTSGGRGWKKYYAKAGDRFIRSLDVQMNYISDNDKVFVSPPNNQEAKRTKVLPFDILLTITGSKIGRVTMVPENFGKGYVSQHVSIIRTEEINPLYLSYYLSDENGGQYQIKKSYYGQTKPGLNFKQIENFEILVPPVELQAQFAQIVEKTEALKTQYQQSLQELENLYRSLSQRAFKGELASPRPVKQKQVNISDKALLAFYQKQIIGHVIKKHQEHRMEQGGMIMAKDLYHLEALYGIKTHFQFKNWHYGTYDNKIRQLINGKDKFFTKKSVGQKGFQVLALGEKSEALFAHKYVKPELEHIDKAMDDLLNLYASFPFKQRSYKIELLNTVCKSIVDAQSTELSEVREVMKQWKTTKAGFKNKAEKFSEQETIEMIDLIINKGWNEKLLD